MKLTAQKVTTYKGHTAPIYCMALLPLAKGWLSAGGDGIIAHWQLNKTDAVAIAQIPEAIFSLKIIDEHTLIAGAISGAMYHLHLAGNATPRKISIASQGIFAIEKIDNQLWVGAGNGMVSILDLQSFELIAQLQLSDKKIRSLVGHQDLVYITDGLGHVIKLTKDLKVLNQYQCHQASCNTIYFNNHQAITGGSDAHLKQWDLETMTVMAQVPAHNFAIYDLIQHQQFLLSASRDKTVKVWEPHTLQLLLRIEAQSHLGHTHSVNALLDLGQQFLSAGDDRQIIAWQLRVED